MGRYLIIPSLMILTIIFTGCDKKITEEELIGGEWVATAGFKDKEMKDDPLCPPFNEGLKFVNEETVVVKANQLKYKYNLHKSDEEYKIDFYDTNGGISIYKIYNLDEDAFGLIGSGIQHKESCYFEREK